MNNIEMSELIKVVGISFATIIVMISILGFFICDKLDDIINLLEDLLENKNTK